MVEKLQELKDFNADNINKAVEYHNQYTTDKRYSTDEKILQEIFEKEGNTLNNEKTDTRLSVIYKIATLINAFYSTRMGNDRVWAVANEINEQDIKPKDYDKKIDEIKEFINNKKFLITTVMDEDEGTSIESEFGAYSFLTKYFAITDRIMNHRDCNFSTFPIYDSFVADGIKNLDEKVFEGTNFNISASNLKNYDNFYDIMHYLQKGYLKEEVTLTAIDNYFWYIGKKKQDYYVKLIKDKIESNRVNIDDWKDNAEKNREIANKIEKDYNEIKKYIPIAIRKIKNKKNK